MTETNREQNIQSKLESKFSFLKDKVKIKRERRLFVEVEKLSDFRSVFDFAVKDLDFKRICMITGLDEGENFAAIYHLATFSGLILDLKTYVPKSNPVIRSVMDTFPGAELYERELVDMFGFKVEGLPEGSRYPLPDDWPDGQYPLRKDWKKEMLDGK
jgi:Ni,Fe-hydrogenase III component G